MLPYLSRPAARSARPVWRRPLRRHLALAIGTVLIALIGALFGAAPALAQSRGELLYTTHCLSCHATQVHWREQRAVGNWSGLLAQVRRWQDLASLGWTDGDILEVSRYLNERIYRFAPVAALASSNHR